MNKVSMSTHYMSAHSDMFPRIDTHIPFGFIGHKTAHCHTRHTFAPSIWILYSAQLKAAKGVDSGRRIMLSICASTKPIFEANTYAYIQHAY